MTLKVFDNNGETNDLGYVRKTSLEAAMKCFAASIYGE